MIIFMGVAGAGKSSQGRRLADEKGYPWLSTGEFLRMLVSGERRLEMLQGKLLEDSEMIQLVDKVLRLIEVEDEFILDGFPRTAKQAKWLLAQEDAGLIKISYVVHLESSIEEVRQRLLDRGRQDDTPEAIEARFKEYEAVTLPIIKDFEAHGIKVHHVDGAGSIEDVHRRMVEQIAG